MERNKLAQGKDPWDIDQLMGSKFSVLSAHKLHEMTNFITIPMHTVSSDYVQKTVGVVHTSLSREGFLTQMVPLLLM